VEFQVLSREVEMVAFISAFHHSFTNFSLAYLTIRFWKVSIFDQAVVSHPLFQSQTSWYNLSHLCSRAVKNLEKRVNKNSEKQLPQSSRTLIDVSQDIALSKDFYSMCFHFFASVSSKVDLQAD